MSSAPSRVPVPFRGIRGASGTAFGRAADPFARPTASPSSGADASRLDDAFRANFGKPFPFTNTRPGNLAFGEDLAERMAKTLYLAKTPLIEAFFSTRNLDRVQAMLVAEVKRLTKLQISRQSDQEVLIVMRAIFADHATHNPRDLGAEVERLNRGVIGATIDGVISGITARLAYIRDASRMRTPIDRGAATSTKGLLTTASLFKPL